MRLRHIKGCEEFVNNSEWTITDPKANKGSWQHPIHVEIGMGKGRFIRDMAKLNFDIFYLGIERYKSVIQKTIERKVKEDEERVANGLTGYDNLRFVCMDALELPEVFAEGVVEFKTDNEKLFDYSLESISASGWELI